MCNYRENVTENYVFICLNLRQFTRYHMMGIYYVTFISRCTVKKCYIVHHIHYIFPFDFKMTGWSQCEACMQ